MVDEVDHGLSNDGSEEGASHQFERILRRL